MDTIRQNNEGELSSCCYCDTKSSEGGNVQCDHCDNQAAYHISEYNTEHYYDESGCHDTKDSCYDCSDVCKSCLDGYEDNISFVYDKYCKSTS